MVDAALGLQMSIVTGGGGAMVGTTVPVQWGGPVVVVTPPGYWPHPPLGPVIITVPETIGVERVEVVVRWPGQDGSAVNGGVVSHRSG